MNAVSPVLLETIKELQGLPSLQSSLLGGGTSLALRYNHRESVDIDLFFRGQIARKGFQSIEKEVYKFYNEAIIGMDYPCDIDDQYVFLRFYVRKAEEHIKVEILQNMCMTDQGESLDGVRALSVNDMGMLKLMAASNRSSFKDIYDLHYITELVPLIKVFRQLQEKQAKFTGESYRTIFDLDGELSPVDNPHLLMKFDDETSPKAGRPAHSTHLFKIVEGTSWLAAKAAWRRKVRQLFKDLNISES
jgi:hypothetical protein